MDYANIVPKGEKQIPENEKKGITVKIAAELHAEVKRYIESQGMTMADFVSKAIYDELHPKIQGKEMENMRTMAFQVPDELFQRIKDYLNRHQMTQKDFVIGLIETELNRDMAMSAEQTVPDIQEESECEELDYDESMDSEIMQM